MPLKPTYPCKTKKCDAKVLSENIAAEMRAGKPQKQAIAIAYSEQRRTRTKKKKK